MRQGKGRKVGKDPFNLSISDLMAGLLTIFILALVCVIVVYREGADNLTRINEQRSDLLVAIHNQLPESTKSKVILDEENGILRIEADESTAVGNLPNLQGNAIFDRGQSVLTPIGEDIISNLGRAFIEMRKNPELASHWKVVDTIMIEGHTDAVPLNQGDGQRTNLDLSTERASYTWKYMNNAQNPKNPKNPDNPNDVEVFSFMKNYEGKPLFSIAGYGDSRLLLPEDSKNAKNRRIEFRFIIKPVDMK